MTEDRAAHDGRNHRSGSTRKRVLSDDSHVEVTAPRDREARFDPVLRNALAYVSWQDRKQVVAALKPIYQAPRADAARLALDAFTAGPWGQKYAAIAPLWQRQWDQVVPFFVFPPEVRQIIYTTNAIESLNSTLSTAVRSRGHFPTDEPQTSCTWPPVSIKA